VRRRGQEKASAGPLGHIKFEDALVGMGRREADEKNQKKSTGYRCLFWLRMESPREATTGVSLKVIKQERRGNNALEHMKKKKGRAKETGTGQGVSVFCQL